jgi:methionine aminotransferase
MNSPEIKSKLPNLPVSIFTSMTQLARKHGAINLGQGFPDFSMDEKLQELVFKAMRDGHNQYAHSHGNPFLREVISSKINSLYGFQPDPETEITITPGGTYAISNALTAVLRDGDEVIIFEPCFDSYIPNIRIMGAVPVTISLRHPDYSIPWDEVRNKITSRTRMILINSPQNPSGSVLSETDIQQLRSIVEGTEILIMSDEVYEHLVFDGEKHESILRYPDLFGRSFVAFSLGKVLHCTGWKIGYCVAPPAFTKEFRNHHQFNVFSVSSALQQGIAEYLQEPQTYLGLPAFFQRKRDLFLEGIKGSIFEPLQTKGSYFQCVQFPEEVAKSSADFAESLTETPGVAAIPLSAFYSDGTDNRVLRFCFAKEDETLLKATERLRNI